MESLCNLKYVSRSVVDTHIREKAGILDNHFYVFIHILLYELFNKEGEAVYISIRNKLSTQYNNIEPDKYVSVTVDGIYYSSYLSIHNTTYINMYTKLHTKHVSSTPELSLYLNEQKQLLINIQKEITTIDRAFYSVSGIGTLSRTHTLVNYIPSELLKSELLQYFFSRFDYNPKKTIDMSGTFETELALIKEKILLNKLLG